MASLAGYARTCGFNSGGAKFLHMAIVADVTSFTLGTLTAAEKYATVTMETGKVFKKYEFEPDTFEIKEDVSIENNSMKVVQSIEWFVAKMSPEGRALVNEIAQESACGMIAIAEDSNGNKWVMGYSQNFVKERPMRLKTSNATSGKKLSDTAGYTIKLESETNEPMRVFTGTVPLT